MSDQAVNVQINVDAQNATAVIKQLTSNLGVFSNIANDVKRINFQAIVANIQNVHQALTSAMKPGADFESSMADLSAITGMVGDDLKEIGDKARANAKVFGGDAAKSVETYKLLLSQLSPELAKTPEALDAMGKNVSILSKTMGGNTSAAAEVLTTAMNQYQVALENPIEASKTMADMMNIMSAAAREGSAELQQIKSALEQVGMVAKTANVSFSETNAAIQVLDKAGKKGSEGGVALRNILGDLDRGRFLPKIIKEEFESVGVNVDVLGDHTLSLTDRLRELQPIMHDGALLSKLFGEANYASGVALLSKIDVLDELNVAIQGTNTAEEQAAIVMDTYKESVSRIQAGFADLKISIFSATGSFMPFIEVVGSGAVEIARLVPLLSLIGNLFKKELYVNISKAAIAIASWTKNIVWNKLIMESWYIMQGAYIIITNLLTGAINLATAATRMFNLVFVSSPLGWIALGIGAIAGAFLLLRNNASEAAEETGKTLKNLQEQAKINIQTSTGDATAERKKQLAIMKAELDNAATSEDKKKIYFKYAEQFGMDFNEKDFEEKPEAYWEHFEDFSIKKAVVAGTREGIENEIGEINKEIEAIKPLADAEQAWNNEHEQQTGTQANAMVIDGNVVFVPVAGESENIARINELKKVLSTLLEELKDTVKTGNDLTVEQTKSIIPNPSDKTDKASDTIKGGEGIKNINVTINDGLIKQVQNIFNNGEANPDSFMDKLREALLMVLNDANTI